MGSRSKKAATSPAYCERCGYAITIQRHRIKPGNEGGKYVLGNVISLCPNAHVLADKGQVTRAELFKLVRIRMKKDLKLEFITKEEHDTAIEWQDTNNQSAVSKANSPRSANRE